VRSARSQLRATFLALFVATCAAQIGMGIIAPIFPLYAHDFTASAFSIGVVFAAFSAARAVLSPAIGRVSDRTDRKLMILLGLVGYGLVSVLFVFATSLLHLGILRFIQGAAAAMIAPIAQAYVGDLTPPGREGRYINVFYSSMFIGMALGPMIGGAVAEAWSYRAAFLLMGALSFGALAIVAAVLPRNNPKDARHSSGQAMTASTGELLRDPGVKTLLVYWITRGFWQQGFNTFYPLFAVAVGGFSESLIGIVLTVQLLASGVLQIPFGWLADRYHRLPQIAIGSVLSPFAMFGILFVREQWTVVLLAFAMGALDALSRASILAARVELGRNHGMGVMAGLQSGGFGIGQLAGPMVCGVVVDMAGVKSIMPFASSVGLIGALLTIIWFRRWTKAGVSG
jgi:DHA1 family multidrug resistance protein-like MFS transporter